MRKEFEKLPEIAAELENSDGELYWCDKQNQYRNNRVFQDSQTGWMNGAWYAWQAKAQAVQEGFVLVSKDKLHEWKCMARRSEELGCPDCYESRGYSHNLAEEIEAQEQN